MLWTSAIANALSSLITLITILSSSNVDPLSSALALSTPVALALGAFLLPFVPLSVGPALLPVVSSYVTPVFTSLFSISTFLILLGSICLCFLDVLSVRA